MNKLLILIILALCSYTVQAQDVQQEEDSRIAFERERIGIDYSMPDFSTKRIDGTIIGERLAKMLNYLNSTYSSGPSNSRLISIVEENGDFLFPPQIKSFRIKEITKVGDVITIKTKVALKKNSGNINDLEIPFVLDKGISESKGVNSLFRYLGRAIEDM